MAFLNYMSSSQQNGTVFVKWQRWQAKGRNKLKKTCHLLILESICYNLRNNENLFQSVNQPIKKLPIKLLVLALETCVLMILSCKNPTEDDKLFQGLLVKGM